MFYFYIMFLTVLIYYIAQYFNAYFEFSQKYNDVLQVTLITINR